MVRLLIQVPGPIKARLDALRQEGTTASGFIRYLREEHFNQSGSTNTPLKERLWWVQKQPRSGGGLLADPDRVNYLQLSRQATIHGVDVR